jgi:ribonuclease P protein component
MGGYGLTAPERIRRRPEFERVYRNGTRIPGRFMTLFVLSNDGGRLRLGVAATRKLGTATERNRAKRLAREVFRRHKFDDGLDVIIIPRREMLEAPFASLEADYRNTLQRRATMGRATARDGGRHRRSAGGNQIV